MRLVACALVVVACGSSSTAGPDASVDASANDAPSDALASKTNAVDDTIASNALCTALPNFYWEIGDANGALASGKVGALFDATTKMDIASASKLVFAAYVVEKFDDDFESLDGNAMRMLSGYVSFDDTSCATSSTVSDCFSQGSNAVFTAADVGKFYYGGGHFQKYAVDLGLGDDDTDALATEIKSLVGTDLAFTYGSPQLAGGINTSASDYASFLRKILSNELAIHDALGVNAVCTLPASCPSAVYSPAPAAWHYSYGHWIEDDPSGDGAFSSPGAFGFYPWIDATKTYYGILARASLDTGAYIASAECGAVIRKAFITGAPQ
jgi:CubicO group peptidase (beta-lactamase class C family)